MACFEQSHEGLENLILKDQYFLTCDKWQQTFLKERGKLSLKDMAKAANDYYEAHGYPADNHDNRDKKPKGYTQDNINRGPTNVSND